ncbi:asparagine synthase-related protein [Actinomycetaceae bacterium MB13-C1-2]|nr:asparagine synthase-related protein [Actinomycetaceae bacterium MB13-C1-2]
MRPVSRRFLDDGVAHEMETNWCAVLVRQDCIVLMEDVVRSHALFYARAGEKWIITDHPDALRSLLPDWRRDRSEAEVFALTGFTLNEGTLVEGVSMVEASSIVTLPLDGAEPKVEFTGLPLHPADSAMGDAHEYGVQYLAALDADFDDLIERSNGRQLVVPLSGGLDSRLIAAMLKRRGASNILAFTYGKRGIPEAAMSRSVADALDIPWVFVEMDPADVSVTWFSEETDSFRSDTWNASALPHVQDWYALRKCKRDGLVEDDAIILPGHTPVGAMHDEQILKNGVSASDIVAVIAEHHCAGSSATTRLERSPEFRKSIRRTFGLVPNNSRRVQNAVSLFNFRERQAKYINNSMSAYEHFGWNWALPLYWPRSLNAWIIGSEELTADRRWYQKFVDWVYAEQAGIDEAIGYIEAPADSARVPFRDQVVKLARKTGVNRPLNRAWSIRTQMNHPLAFEAFVKDQSDVSRLGRLLRENSLVGIWSRDFLDGKWGSGRQQLVPLECGEQTSNREKPSVLLISYSDISHDARLLKQIGALSNDFNVTVCGHGDSFETPAELLLFDCKESKSGDRVRATLLHLGLYGLAQRLEADNLAAHRLLAGREFDAVIANDIEPVGLAIELFGADRVHADLHEYYPGLQDQDEGWVKLRQPYYRWMLANHASNAVSTTTVSAAIAKRYMNEFGFEPGVVENALPLVNVDPTPVHHPIRLVHAGAALPNRHIEIMMRAVARSISEVTLDLYLTGTGTQYHRSLEQLSDDLGPRIRVLEPIARGDLVGTLNHYDVGIHFLPATATNNVLALPNKFFDFVQARLGVVVGPTEEMARRVEQYGIGAVTDDFSEDALVRTIDGLDAERINEWKQNASVAATHVDVTPMLEVWREAVTRICSPQTTTGGDGDYRPRARVDVIIAVHDPKRPIARAVASVLKNNRTPIRTIVVAHNVSRELIAGQLGEWAHDERVLLVHCADGIHSPSGPMNLGFDCASAEFTALLGSDDTLEPGAIDRWMEIAERGNGADFVIANRQEPEGISASVPPVRVGRRVDLDGAKDRLVYRAAPLGLIRRSVFGEVRFPTDIPTGEDILFSNKVWFSGARIAFAFGPPGYVVHSDQDVRVTTTRRSVASELKWIPLATDPSAPGMSVDGQRRALIVKILRSNIPDAVRNRVAGGLSEQDRKDLQKLTRSVIASDPGALGCLSRSEHRLIRGICEGNTSLKELSDLLVERSRLHSFDALVPVNRAEIFSRQAPLRYHIASWTLGRQGRCANGS